MLSGWILWREWLIWAKPVATRFKRLVAFHMVSVSWALPYLLSLGGGRRFGPPWIRPCFGPKNRSDDNYIVPKVIWQESASLEYRTKGHWQQGSADKKPHMSRRSGRRRRQKWTEIRGLWVEPPMVKQFLHFESQTFDINSLYRQILPM